MTEHRGFGVETEITTMNCKTRARTYEVPISFCGRTNEEGCKAGLIDGLMAIHYILYHNLVAPWLPSGRAYVRAANRFLETFRPLVNRKEPAMLRKAFSLVELLVVICIIGILIALLLPAIESARESGRRVHCMNNMRQLATSCLAYHDAVGTFPPAMEVPRKGLTKDSDPGQTAKWGPNWVIRILPFCEENGLYFQFDLSKPISDPANAFARATRMATMLCPSDSYNHMPYNPVKYLADEGPNWARGNYGANGAIQFLNGPVGSNKRIFLGPGSKAWNTTGGTAAGSQPISRGVMGCNEACAMRQITDGASQTVMLGELRCGTTPVDRRGTWAMGAAGASSLWGHGATDDHGPNAGGNLADDIKDGNEIIAAAGGDSMILTYDRMGCSSDLIKSSQATARSLHLGGVNVAMCDGSVHFISDDIDHGSNQLLGPDWKVPRDLRKLHVWERLMVSCDGQFIDGNAW